MKKYFYIAALLLTAGQLSAQNEYDALRFSQTYIQGTARSAAMGGAFGALGGDLGCLPINPAGLGVYNRNDLNFTLDFISNEVRTSPSSGLDSDTKYALKFSSLGIAGANKNGATSGFTGINWGVAYNRLNDFSANENFNYVNPSGSLLDVWVDNANGTLPGDLSQFNTGLAKGTYLIDNIEDSQSKYCNPYQPEWGASNPAYGERQIRSASRKGGINSWDFALAADFANTLYIGGSIGVQTLRYNSTSNYAEEDESNYSPIDHFEYIENYKVTGSGINLKLGVIFKPINYVRLGAAFHTPTMYQLTEKYYSELESFYDEGTFDDGVDHYREISDNNTYDYRLNTPLKGILSAAFVMPGYGILSIDYEAVDYSKAKFNNEENDTYNFRHENNAIAEKMQRTNNLRIGVEGLAGPMSIRAGYALYGNPYKFVNGNKQRQILSAGLGFKGEEFYFDIAATYHIYQTDDFLYESANHQQRISYDNRYLYIMATLGLRL